MTNDIDEKIDELNKILKTPEDILNENKKELIEQKQDEEKIEIQKSILKLLEKNFSILESEKSFKTLIENNLKTMMEENDEKMTAIVKTKIYEIISLNESNKFVAVTKMCTDLMKTDKIGEKKDDTSGFGGLTRENVQDINEVMKFIKQAKNISDLTKQEKNEG